MNTSLPNAPDPPDPNQPTKTSRRWVAWAAISLLLLFVGSLVAWTFIEGLIATKIKNQLADLELGDSKIGSISISTEGVTAHDIEFRHAPDDDSPWLEIGSLGIKQSILELAQGAETFDRIELDAAEASVDLKELLSQSADVPSLDLSQFKLPAKEVSVTNASLRIFEDHRALNIAGVDLKVTQDSGKQSITGHIEDLLGGQCDVSAEINPSENTYTANLTSNDLPVDSGLWQSLPYVPEDLSRYLTASGSLRVNTNITGNAKTPVVVDGTGIIKSMDLNLPAFDLPISITKGNFAYDLQQIKLHNVIATIDGQDTISAEATTRIGAFPIVTNFAANFEGLATDSLRKLVAEIPETLVARCDGSALGNVTLEDDLRTTIVMDADGTTGVAQYGDLNAKSSKTFVKLESLVFDAEQNLESIGGSISTVADASAQPLKNVFNTFDIGPLYQQLDLAGSFSGQAKIDLPLATIDDLKTWQLSVSGLMPNGQLAGQSIYDANLSGRLNHGVLELSPLLARTSETAGDGQIRADIAWPLVAEQSESIGNITVAGAGLPADWAIGFLQNQVSQSESTSVREENSFSKSIEEIDGAFNFNALLEIPVGVPDDLQQWKVNGTIQDSAVVVGGQALQNLGTTLGMRNGKLRLADLSGSFSGNGGLYGDVTIDLGPAAQHQVDVNAEKLPLLWLVTVGKNVSPDFSQRLNTYFGITAANPINSDSLSGNITAGINFTALPLNSPTPWSANLKLDSDELRLVGNVFKNLDLKVSSDSKNVVVKELTSNFGPSGWIKAKLDWNLESNSGNGDVSWKSISIQSILQAVNVESVPITGATDGQLTITSPPMERQNTDILSLPINIQGQVSANDLTAAKIRVKPFQFDVATRSNAIHIENFRTENEAIDLDLKAKSNLEAPYEFSATGAIAGLQLSQLLKQSSVADRENEVADVSGVMSGNFQFDGQLYPLQLHTNGNLKIARPSYNNKPYQDIDIDWDHLGSEWRKSKLQIDAFGGEIKMVELTEKPERIKVKITDIDARKVTSLFDLPVKLSGTLHGAASLNDWSIEQSRWANLEMTGSSMLVSEIKIGDFTGAAEYRSNKFTYGVDGALLGGKFEGRGETTVGETRLEKIDFPMEFTLNNALLAKLSRKSNLLRNLRNLDGNVSATAQLIVGLDRPFEGDGRVRISDAKWRGEPITRLASVHFNLSQGRLIINDVRAGLKRGSIKANALVPLSGNSGGKYECEIRQMDLARIAAIATDDPLKIEGLLDARINGQLGKIITGQGYIGLDRASLNGIDGQSLRLPIQFAVSAANGSGHAELQRSTFRLFGGSVSGIANMSFGTGLTLDSDLKFTRIDTGTMIQSLVGSDQVDQGELNGRLKIKGRSVRSIRDLKGSFEGKLDRTSAFELPVLEDLTRVLGGQVLNDNFSSEDIEFLLDNGRVEVKNLNLSSSLASVTIGGFAFLDGRLDLDVAAQIERINQPTLIEQLAGSPLAALRGTPVSFFAQAARFLSDRVVFLKVRGTANRPQVRVDTKQQLREETIRYFLRGSQILPTGNLRNN